MRGKAVRRMTVSNKLTASPKCKEIVAKEKLRNNDRHQRNGKKKKDGDNSRNKQWKRSRECRNGNRKIGHAGKE